MKILTEIFCSRSRKREGLEDMELHKKLANKQCRIYIRKFSFSQRTVNEWNRLSADCVGASSVNMFKTKSTYT